MDISRRILERHNDEINPYVQGFRAKSLDDELSKEVLDIIVPAIRIEILRFLYRSNDESEEYKELVAAVVFAVAERVEMDNNNIEV